MSVEESDLPAETSAFLRGSKVGAFLEGGGGGGGGGGGHARAIVIDHDGDDNDDDGCLVGCLVGSTDAKGTAARMREAFQRASVEANKGGRKRRGGGGGGGGGGGVPVTLPSRAGELPWSLLESQDALVSVTLSPECLFSRAARAAVRLLLQLLGDPRRACAVVERGCPITRRFLRAEGGFSRVAHRGERFCVLAYEDKEATAGGGDGDGDEEEEEEEEQEERMED